MPAKYLLAAACAVALNLTTAAAFAGANEYAFEPLAAEIKKGDDVVVALRLTHKPSGKPVVDAVRQGHVRTRHDGTPRAVERAVGRQPVDLGGRGGSRKRSGRIYHRAGRPVPRRRPRTGQEPVRTPGLSKPAIQ